MRTAIEDIFRKNDSAGFADSLPGWLRNVLIALSVTFLIYFSIIYIHYGEIFREFNYTIPLELSFTFLYFLALFQAHKRISEFIHSGALKNLPSFGLYLVEGLTVAVTTFILNNVIMFFPFWVLLFYLNASFDPDHVRMHYIIQMIISLFFYYFVERERARKQLRLELLRTARLQKENFYTRLETLKNRVNPHFLFSSLDALDSIIGKDREKAVEFVNKLSFVYRSLLDSKDQLVSLSEEKELAEAFIFLLKARYENRIKCSLSIPDQYLNYQIPPGSLRLLLEDALAVNEPAPDNIPVIRIYCEENLIIAYSLKKGRKDPEEPAGLKNVRSRYQFLTDQEVKAEFKNDLFQVSLPLLKVALYEDRDQEGN